MNENFSERTRLLHVFSTFDHGGAEARTLQLMRHFGASVEHVVLIGEPSAIGAKAAIDTHLAVSFADGKTDVLGRPGLQRYHRLARRMRGFDLILTYSWGAMDVVMAHRLFGKMINLPPLIHHEDGYELAEQRPIRRHFRRIAMQTCRTVIVPSTVLESIARSDWHINESKLARISNGIDVASYALPAIKRSFPGLTGQHAGIVVGTIAGLRAVKNLPRLVRAVAAAGPDVHLAIAGEGAERGTIAAEAARLGMSNRLHMPGFLSDPASYIGHFDIFALSSDSEQFPIAVAEAMAAELPVVSTDVGDIRSMVSVANQPYIVPSGDEAGLAQAIAELASSAELRTSIGRDNASIAARDFQQSAMFAAYRQIFDAVIGKPIAVI